MSWRISGDSEFCVSLAPPCSPDENRLAIPYFSNASALRDRVRWGTSISLARSPAVWWNRTRGLICSYSSCSGHSVHCLMLAHSSVRARRSLFGRASPLAFPRQRCVFQAYRIPHRFASIQCILSPFGYPMFASLEFPSMYTMLRDSLCLFTIIAGKKGT